MKGKLYSESIFGMITALVALVFIKISLGFRSGTQDGVPGPGYFPILVACMVLLFSVLLIVQGMREKKEYFTIDAEQKSCFIQMLEILGCMALFLVLWQFVPFLVAGIAFVLAMCRILKQKWKFAIVYSVAVVGVLYLIFSVAFRVNLNLM